MFIKKYISFNLEYYVTTIKKSFYTWTLIKWHGAVKILQLFLNCFCRPLSQNLVYTDPAMCTAVFGPPRVCELYKVPPWERTGLDLIRGPHSSHLGSTCHPPWVKQEVWGKSKLCQFFFVKICPILTKKIGFNIKFLLKFIEIHQLMLSQVKIYTGTCRSRMIINNTKLTQHCGSF